MSKPPLAPALFDPQDAFRGPYAARIAAFSEAGRQADLPPASEDRETVALVLVDYQHDFVDPSGTLFVPGSQEDIARLLNWFYTCGARITSIYASLDTHLPVQIFYGSWWRHAETGAQPEPFTTISVEDVNAGRWIPVREPEWSRHYVEELRQRARKELMIWPYHTMEGTLGHMLVAPLSEAIAWHSAARQTQPHYITKGRTMRTEFYGIFGAEVPDAADPASLLNVDLLHTIMQHDRVYLAGEAKSHCVLESGRQLVQHFSDRPELLQRLYVLRDCISAVRHPSIDFDALAEEELARWEHLGVHLVRSSETIA
jgi:nicotinamidase/pyrazinamidase